MLTIKNFKSLEGIRCNGWMINLVSEGVYLYDDADLSILEPEYYSIGFELGDNNIGKILIGREFDKEYETQYRYIIYLNQKKFTTGGLNAHQLQDTDGFIQSVVDALGVINDSYNGWLTNQNAAFARQIARTATGHGFYSFWMLKFTGIQLVIDAINAEFKKDMDIKTMLRE